MLRSEDFEHQQHRRQRRRNVEARRRANESIDSQRQDEELERALEEVDANNLVGPVDMESLQEIHELAETRLGTGMDEDVCAVCDNLVLSTSLTSKGLEDLPLEEMRAKLAGPSDLPYNLRLYYSPCEECHQLAGLLLSKAGVRTNHPSSPISPTVTMCTSCEVSLKTLSTGGPPKFAIANGNFMGRLPCEFDDVTRTELAMTSLAQSSMFLSTVQGGRHKCLRSHSYSMKAVPGPPATLLPRNVVESAAIQVTIVGALTPDQYAATAAKYTCRTAVYAELAHFLHKQQFFVCRHRCGATCGGSRNVRGT